MHSARPLYAPLARYGRAALDRMIEDAACSRKFSARDLSLLNRALDTLEQLGADRPKAVNDG